MRLHSIVVIITLLLVAVQPTQARDTDKSLSQFRVFLKSGEKIDGKLGFLTENQLIGRSVSGLRLNIDRKDIIAFESRSGSYGGTGAVIGVCAGFALALGAENSATSYKRKWGSVLLVFLGSMSLGTLVGGAIGYSFKKWERVSLSSTVGGKQPQCGGGLVLTYHF